MDGGVYPPTQLIRYPLVSLQEREDWFLDAPLTLGERIDALGALLDKKCGSPRELFAAIRKTENDSL